ncbi:MAG: GNAT family N-acetyltransferase [Marinicella sp.]
MPQDKKVLMCFKFIKATKQDKDYLLKLRQLTMVEHLERSGFFLSKQEHEIRLDDAFECSHLIFYEDQVIGTLKFQELEEKIEIMQFQIHPNHQCKGLGQKILEKLIGAYSPKYLELTVLKENKAVNLYQRLGFSIFGEDQFEYFMRTRNTDRHL